MSVHSGSFTKNLLNWTCYHFYFSIQFQYDINFVIAFNLVHIKYNIHDHLISLINMLYSVMYTLSALSYHSCSVPFKYWHILCGSSSHDVGWGSPLCRSLLNPYSTLSVVSPYFSRTIDMFYFIFSFSFAKVSRGMSQYLESIRGLFQTYLVLVLALSLILNLLKNSHITYSNSIGYFSLKLPHNISHFSVSSYAYDVQAWDNSWFYAACYIKEVNSGRDSVYAKSKIAVTHLGWD